MTRTGPPEPATMPGRAAPRPRRRLHLVYYVLAVFDLVTVCLSLFIIARIAGIFEQSVAVNKEWAERIGAYSELRQLAAAVNLPANEIFETRDVQTETRRLDAALADFREKMAVARSDLAENIEPSKASTLLVACDAADESVMRMVAGARRIFELFATGRADQAGEEMARMDRSLTEASASLATLGGAVQSIQIARLDEQQAAAESVRKLEILIAGLILIMVAGVTVYGHVLARRTKEASDELHRHRAHLEDLVAERTRELEASHEHLRLADRLASIGTLAAGLGHDMNNMLFPLRCRIDTLEAAATEPSTRRELTAVRTSVAHLQQLSDGLRLLALDPDDPRAGAGVTPVAAWSEEVAPMLRTALPALVELDVDVPDGLPAMAVAAHALTQAVFNLVVNAGEAMTGTGVVRLWARSHDDHRFVQVGVTDNGPGMSAEVRRQALDPFYTTKVRGVSTGLGLALVHGVANRAGGTVEIDTAPGRGTTVVLSLPAHHDDAGEATAAARGATVTLADRRMASVVSALLAREGFEVIGPNGDGAPAGDLLVTDARPEAIDPARRFLAGGPGRRVIAWGGTGDSVHQWSDLGALHIDESGGLAALQDAIHAVRSGTDGGTR